jgi:guanylate kinase
MSRQGKLIVFCGKMAAGKSTLSKALAEQERAADEGFNVIRHERG